VSFTAATYNVLATAYIRPDFYPRTLAARLDPSWRVPALVAHVAHLAADVICLQEVEAAPFAALRDGLAPASYEGSYAAKSDSRPDGCATFLHADMLALRDERRLVYADGSGHIALVTRLARAGRLLGVANTHLKWDPPNTPVAARHGMRQIDELLATIAADRECEAWLICGDLNATPESEVIARLQRAGFVAAHRLLPTAFTANSNGVAKTIDYLFHTERLRAVPVAPPPLDGATPLPSPEQPSDHLALVASFDWTG
jgi:mRNA deadenylase 3'-5' endonuclease subunit Ccr4